MSEPIEKEPVAPKPVAAKFGRVVVRLLDFTGAGAPGEYWVFQPDNPKAGIRSVKTKFTARAHEIDAAKWDAGKQPEGERLEYLLDALRQIGYGS